MLTKQTNGKTLFGNDEKLRENWDEIEWKEPPLKKCPHCAHLKEDGHLILVDKVSEITGKKVKFWGCSNFKKGCRYIYESRSEKSTGKGVDTSSSS